MVRRDLPTDAMPAGRLTQYVVERYAPDLSLVANVLPFCANSGAADAAHGRGDPSADFQSRGITSRSLRYGRAGLEISPPLNQMPWNRIQDLRETAIL